MQRLTTKAMSLFATAALLLSAPAVASDKTAVSASKAYEAKLLTPHQDQALSYGGGLEWSLRVDGSCRIYVREFGDPASDSWIILHGGWGAEHSYLLDAFKGLEDERHLIFYDQRGSLRSPCDESDISVQAHVDDLDALREALNLESVNIVGHSIGGFLAARYLEQHPERVSQLILMAPARLKQPLNEDEETIAVPRNEAVEKLQQRPEVEETARAHGLWVDDIRELGPRERTLQWRLNFASVNIYQMDRWHLLRGGDVYYSQSAGNAAGQTMGDELPYDFTDLLRQHDFPVSLIVGERDYVDWDARLNRYWFDDDERVELIALAEAGHNLWLDRPATVHAALQRLMRPHN